MECLRKFLLSINDELIKRREVIHFRAENIIFIKNFNLGANTNMTIACMNLMHCRH